jgi:transcriptional regulator with XRE-family HTH domain
MIIHHVRQNVNSDFIIFYMRIAQFLLSDLTITGKIYLKGWGYMLGHSLAKARNEAGYSQREAAARLNISQGYVGGLETGRNDPEIVRILIAMAELYQCTLHKLLDAPNAEKEKVSEIDDLLYRLSPKRKEEVLEIIKLFLLLDSQEYRTETMEDLIVGSEMFDNGRVLTLLLAQRDKALGSVGVDGLCLAK